jgi:hypothetical protein
MAKLAERFGYHYERAGNLHFFTSRPMARAKGALLWRAVSPLGLRTVRAYLAWTMTGAFAERDRLALK